jgi:phosphatidylinositol dimannoside acyltransferase
VDKGQAALRTYSTLSRCLSAIPEPVALGVANVAGDVLFKVRGDQRAMVTNNLRRLLGADADDPNDRLLLERWARRSFRAYARYWVEFFRLGRTSPGEVEQRMLVQGMGHLAQGMATGKGVVMALPHVGSWEFGGAFLATQGFPMTAVAERLEPPALFDLFVEQRAAMNLTIVPLDSSSGSTLMATLRNGGLVGLLCDRDIVGNGIEVEFFGETTTMPAGPATLAMRTGASLITAAVYSGPGRDHSAVIEGPIDTTRRGTLREDVARVTQEIAHRFEDLIRRAPDQWHVFQPFWLADRVPA